jgi:DHA1 family bicyclomycin/chloramphenicol resistance-like MFS transporter
VNPSRRRRAEFFLALGGLAAMGPVSMDMFFPALPAAGRDLQVPPSAVMLTMTASLIGMTVGQAIGPLSDVVGRRRPLLLGVVLFTAASLACATARSLEVLTAARFVQGLAAATGIVISRAIIRDLYTGADVARHYSTLIFLVGLSAVVSPTIATQILGLTSWRGIFLALFGLGAVLLAAILLRLPESLPVERRRAGNVRETSRTYRVLVRDRRFVGYAVTLAGGTGAITALMTGSTFVVQDEFGASTQAFAFLFSAGAVAVVATTVLNRRLLRSFSPRRLLAVGLTSSAVGALALLAFGRLSLFAFAPCFIVVIASWGLISANATASAVRDYAPVAGSALALTGLMQYTVGALAAPLAGAVGGGTAVSVGAVVSCFSLVGLGSALLTVGGERKRGGRSTGGGLRPLGTR